MVTLRLFGIQLSVEDQLVVLVGGGSILVKPEGSETLKGASNVICPKYCQVWFFTAL